MTVVASKTLRQRQAEKRLDNAQVAAFCKVHKATVSFWRIGQKRPSSYHFDLLCLLLDCSPEELTAALDATKQQRDEGKPCS